LGKNKQPTSSSALAPKQGSLLDRMREEKTVAEVRDMDFDTLLAQLNADGQVLDASQLGEGFHLLQGKDEKKKLVGEYLAVIDWVINPGKFGGFATLKIKTKFPIRFGEEGYQNFIVNDGSTGIKRQIQDMQAQGFTGVIVCRKGFRVSEDYEVTETYTDDNGDTKERPVLDPATGKPILATTFYLDTSL
jgi:hypothetical protein